MADNKQKSKKSSTIVRIVCIAIPIIVIIAVCGSDPNIKNFGKVFSMINPIWIIGALGCTVGYLLTDGWLLHSITSFMHKKKIPYSHSLKVGIVGLFYSAITPSSSGGQPFQILYMKRDDIPVGASTCIVLIKFIAYALTSVVYFLISMLILGNYYIENYSGIFWFSLLGFIIFAAAIVFIILTMVKKEVILKLASGIIGLVSKIKIKGKSVVKDPQEAYDTVDKMISEYSQAARYIVDNKLKAVGAFFISMLNIGLYFAITYFIYRSFGFNEATFVTVMSLQALLYLGIAYMPVPGSAGVSEGSFYVVYTAFFSSDLVFMAVLLWRFMTYYLVLAIGALTIVFDEISIVRKNKKAQLEQAKIENADAEIEE